MLEQGFPKCGARNHRELQYINLSLTFGLDFSSESTCIENIQMGDKFKEMQIQTNADASKLDVTVGLQRIHVNY